jgi:hypothetical protein
MQTHLNTFRNHCYYFNDSGIPQKEESDSEHHQLQTIGFKLNDGRIMNLFLKYNPWKLLNCSENQIMYQYCVFCGEKRFEHKKFNESRPGDGESNILCKKVECLDKWDDFIEHEQGDAINFIFLKEIEKLQSFCQM